jgi:hypothetical protein
MEPRVHIFDPDLAAEIGLEEAIVAAYFGVLINHNKQNKTNDRDGRTWTYNSIEAIAARYPYWSTKQVRRIMASLIKQGVLVRGNFGGYDRRTWYAFGDKKPFAQTGKWNCPNGQMELPKRANGIVQTGKCLIGAVDKPVELPVDKRNLSQLGLSKGTSRVIQRADCALLKRMGVDPGVAEAIVYEQQTSSEDIRQAVGNAVAKEWGAEQEGGAWTMEPGYIVGIINTAFREGHAVKPSCEYHRMANFLKSKTTRPLGARPIRDMSPKEFEDRKQKLVAQLKENECERARRVETVQI